MWRLERRWRANSGQAWFQLRVVELDVSSLASVRRFVQKLEGLPIDCLINNAGLFRIGDSKRHTTTEGHELHWATNFLGPFLLTSLLLDKLQSSSLGRVVNVVSSTHRLAPPNFDGGDYEVERRYSAEKAYAQSKLATIMVGTYELQRRLAPGVDVVAAHPGVVATNVDRTLNKAMRVAANLTAKKIFKSTTEGAATTLVGATDPNLKGRGGVYLANCRVVRSSNASYDRATQGVVWEVACKTIGKESDWPSQH